WMYANQQGSVVALANSSGATTSSQAYGPFGETDGTPASRFGYTGQQYLAPLGLYYYKARMYSPALGRFLQTDPIGYKDDLNWYAYVGNNPINNIDPNGEWAVNIVMGALNAGIGLSANWVTGEQNPYTLAKNVGVDFFVGAMAGPVAGKAASAGVQLATKTGQNVASTTMKLEVGSLFALGAAGEGVKAAVSPGSISTNQMVAASILAGSLTAAPGIGKAISVASNVSGVGAKMVSAVNNIYSGAATGFANSMFTSAIGKAASASGFK
ncbi:RHS repeat-associated core domain-containing protein, partial [Burkholderia sp. BCC1977]|uniref:RHS repeat-associated core domain-containing protein n=1 Tax=Burkholderia sp. BCC1977 TaxID=2817440 RepID=UPI002ABE7980